MTESLGLFTETYSPDNLLAGHDGYRTTCVTLLSGEGALTRGTLLGKITKSTPTIGTAAGTNTGNGTCTSVMAGLQAKLGTYTLTCKAQSGGTLTTPTTGTAGTNVGNGTCTSVTAGPYVQPGTYTLTCISKTGGALTIPVTGTAGTNTGNGTCEGVTGSAGVKAGIYLLTCTGVNANSGTFRVENPDGYLLPSAKVAVPYISSEINFTIMDGSTDFALGDTFAITVTDGGTFSVETPKGESLPNAVIGAYTSNQINFTLVDGSSDFGIGDIFTITITNGGTFSVKDPEGNVLPDAVVGGGYVNDQINFTLTDGSTDFVVGDIFTITVAAGNGKFKKSVATSVDGSQTPCAILAEDADSTLEDRTTCAYIAGSFNENYVTYGTGHTAASVKDALYALGIFLKTPVIAN